MPFTLDLSLIMQEDGVAVCLEVRGVAFEVEVEFCQSDDIVLRPTSLGHVMQ